MGRTIKDLKKMSRDSIGPIPRVKVFEDERFLHKKKPSTRELLIITEEESCDV